MKTQNESNTQNETNLERLYGQWKAEHEQLDRHATELTEWVAEQSKQRAAQFRETVRRLDDLSSRLKTHFDNEEAIGLELCVSQYGSASIAEAAQRQCERDHANISKRLKHLIDRMQDGEAECDVWKSGVLELNLIIDVLEQHEEQESENVCYFLPIDAESDEAKRL